MMSPMYLVSLDILKADLHLYDTVLARRNGQCMQKCFSLSLVLSNSFQKDLPGDRPFSDDSGGRLEVNESWNRQLSYSSRNGRMVCSLIFFSLPPLFYMSNVQCCYCFHFVAIAS